MSVTTTARERELAIPAVQDSRRMCSSRARLASTSPRAKMTSS